MVLGRARHFLQHELDQTGQGAQDLVRSLQAGVQRASVFRSVGDPILGGPVCDDGRREDQRVAEVHGAKPADRSNRPHPAHGAHAHGRPRAARRQLFLHRHGSQEERSQGAFRHGADGADPFVRGRDDHQQEHTQSLRVGFIRRLDVIAGQPKYDQWNIARTAGDQASVSSR